MLLTAMEYLRDESNDGKESSMPHMSNMMTYLSNGPNNSGEADVATCATDIPHFESPEVLPKEGGFHKKEKDVERLRKLRTLGESFYHIIILI